MGSAKKNSRLLSFPPSRKIVTHRLYSMLCVFILQEQALNGLQSDTENNVLRCLVSVILGMMTAQTLAASGTTRSCQEWPRASHGTKADTQVSFSVLTLDKASLGVSLGVPLVCKQRKVAVSLGRRAGPAALPLLSLLLRAPQKCIATPGQVGLPLPKGRLYMTHIIQIRTLLSAFGLLAVNGMRGPLQEGPFQGASPGLHSTL